MQFKHIRGYAVHTKICAKENLKKLELMREFIHDCLYNSSYGYFSKNVNIFQAPQPIPFIHLQDQNGYLKELKKLYLTNHQISADNDNYKKTFQQLWHTPSELFKPFYGRSVANFMHSHSNSKLVIYEIGPGNGTLAENILDCLRESYPEIYEETEYNLVEISDQLRCKQTSKLLPKHANRVKFPKLNFLNLLNDAIEFKEVRDCWIVGMEVLDNLAHDMIKFRNEDGSLMEGFVHTDPLAVYGSIPGRYRREFKTAKDPLIIEYVQMAGEFGWNWPSLTGNSMLRAFERLSSFGYINPWSCEFIPTMALNLFKGLVHCFPNHRVLFSDFDMLPNAVPGHNGPVVQTRYRGETVPCSTVMLERGLFDIFFPTDFKKLSQIHANLIQKSGHGTIRNHSVYKHAEFIKKWTSPADIEATTTQSGYNPMIQDFENVSFYTCT